MQNQYHQNLIDHKDIICLVGFLKYKVLDNSLFNYIDLPVLTMNLLKFQMNIETLKINISDSYTVQKTIFRYIYHYMNKLHYIDISHYS